MNTAADNEPASAAVEAPSSPRFVNTTARSEAVSLDWPIEHDGKVWSVITVRRMSVADIMVLERKVDETRAAGGDVASIRFPMFDAPDEVLNALDVDDGDKLMEVTNRFLPSRYRADPVK